MDNIIELDNLNEDAWIVLNGKRISFIDFTAPPATRYRYEIHIMGKNDYLFTILSNADTMDTRSGAGMILSHFRLLN